MTPALEGVGPFGGAHAQPGEKDLRRVFARPELGQVALLAAAEWITNREGTDDHSWAGGAGGGGGAGCRQDSSTPLWHLSCDRCAARHSADTSKP